MDSSYYSWIRLLELKATLIYLVDVLKKDSNKKIKMDGKALEKIMLDNKKWKLMEDLVKILEKFEKFKGNSKLICSRDWNQL